MNAKKSVAVRLGQRRLADDRHVLRCQTFRRELQKSAKINQFFKFLSAQIKPVGCSPVSTALALRTAMIYGDLVLLMEAAIGGRETKASHSARGDLHMRSTNRLINGLHCCCAREKSHVRLKKVGHEGTPRHRRDFLQRGST